MKQPRGYYIFQSEIPYLAGLVGCQQILRGVLDWEDRNLNLQYTMTLSYDQNKFKNYITQNAVLPFWVVAGIKSRDRRMFLPASPVPE